MKISAKGKSVTVRGEVEGVDVVLRALDVDGDGDTDVQLVVGGVPIGSVDVRKLSRKLRRWAERAIKRARAWKAERDAR